jgi:TPR repeat protein
MHNTGRGVPRDVGRAAVLYERGCRGGDGSGCNNLGTLYEFGSLGLAPDEERAAALYGEACEKGDAQGCGNVGVVRLRRPLTGAARNEAVSLLRESCAKGSTRACRTLEEIGVRPR